MNKSEKVAGKCFLIETDCMAQCKRMWTRITIKTIRQMSKRATIITQPLKSVYCFYDSNNCHACDSRSRHILMIFHSILLVHTRWVLPNYAWNGISITNSTNAKALERFILSFSFLLSFFSLASMPYSINSLTGCFSHCCVFSSSHVC